MTSQTWKVKPSLDTPHGGIWLGPDSNGQKDGLWLGTLSELGPAKRPQVWLSTAKEQVIAVVGKRGSGKSFTLGVIAEGLTVSAGNVSHVSRQTVKRAMLLFDPLDIYWTMRFPVAASSNEQAQEHFELAESVKLTHLQFMVEAWVPGSTSKGPLDPAWFQVLQLPVPHLGFEEWELLLGSKMLTEPIGQALADTLALVRELGFRQRGAVTSPKALFDIADLANATKADELSANYHPETLRALRQRLLSLHSSGLFSSVGTTIGSLVAPGRLTVILLGRLSQSYRSAVVAVLTRMLAESRGVAAFAEKRLALDPTLDDEERSRLEAALASAAPRTVVALDEAQAFLAPGIADAAKDVFVRLVKEGRNLGLSAVIATQQPSAIDQRILSQVETFISHQLVTDSDIRAVRDNLKSSLPDSVEFGQHELDAPALIRMLSPGQCLVSSADTNTTIRRSLILSVRPRATVHGGIEL